MNFDGYSIHSLDGEEIETACELKGWDLSLVAYWTRNTISVYFCTVFGLVEVDGADTAILLWIADRDAQGEL
jgi:hypothetical protein